MLLLNKLQHLIYVDWCKNRMDSCPTKMSDFLYLSVCGCPPVGDGQVDFEEFMTILGPKLLSSDNREGFLGTTIDNIFWQVRDAPQSRLFHLTITVICQLSLQQPAHFWLWISAFRASLTSLSTALVAARSVQVWIKLHTQTYSLLLYLPRLFSAHLFDFVIQTWRKQKNSGSWAFIYGDLLPGFGHARADIHPSQFCRIR